MQRPRFQLSLPARAGLFVLLIGVLAGANLWLLVHLYQSASRATATTSVLHYGALLARHLAQQPLLTHPLADDDETAQFDRTVGALEQTEERLEYVTVSENDLVIFSKRRALAEAAPSASPALNDARDAIRIGRARIMMGGAPMPVLTFTQSRTFDDGRTRTVQVALRKDAVERELAGATSAIGAMYGMSAVTLGVAFGLCLLIVIRLTRRELQWQKQRRLDEHLAFAEAVAAGILHDFRNPLSALRLDAQLLQRETAKGAAQRAERVAELAARLGGTLERVETLLKEFTFLSGAPSAERERFDLNACLRECLALLDADFARASVAHTIALCDRPLWVYGVAAACKRALLNVLVNARQFSPAGATVTVRTTTQDGEAVVTILDEGPGIAEAERERIFDLFFSRRPGGTGLGLALAKAAVERCGGRIAAEPPLHGKGGRFVIRLPLDGSPGANLSAPQRDGM